MLQLVEAAEEFEDEKGITPLYVAATWGYPELVKYLLQKEAPGSGWAIIGPANDVSGISKQLVCPHIVCNSKHDGSKWTLLTDSWMSYNAYNSTYNSHMS